MKKDIRKSVESRLNLFLNINDRCYNNLLHTDTRYNLNCQFINALNDRYLAISHINYQYNINLYDFSKYSDNYTSEEVIHLIEEYRFFLDDIRKKIKNRIHLVQNEFQITALNKHTFREIIGGIIPKEATFRNVYIKENNYLDMLFNNRNYEIMNYIKIRDDIKQYLVLSEICSQLDLDSSDTLIDDIFSDFKTVICYLKKANKFKKYKKFIINAMINNRVMMNFDFTDYHSQNYPNKNVNLKINFSLPFDEIIEQIKKIYMEYDDYFLVYNDFFDSVPKIKTNIFKYGNRLKLLREQDNKLAQSKRVFVTKLFIFDCFLFGISDSFVKQHLNNQFKNVVDLDVNDEVITKRRAHFEEIRDYIINNTFRM